MVFHEIEHARAADAVVKQIEELILQGVLRPGDKIPGERTLSKTLNVSRPVLRDALRELETRELLITHQGEGTQVADVVGTVFKAPVVHLIRKHPRATQDYVEFRREVEGMAASMAAERATDADRDRLRDLVEKMKAAHTLEDFSLEAQLDAEFHQTIGECAHNIILLHTLRSCYRLLEQGVFFNRSRLYSHQGSRDALLAQHLAISDGILSRNPQAAMKAAQAHMDFVKNAATEVATITERENVAAMRRDQYFNSRADKKSAKSGQKDQIV